MSTIGGFKPLDPLRLQYFFVVVRDRDQCIKIIEDAIKCLIEAQEHGVVTAKVVNDCVLKATKIKRKEDVIKPRNDLARLGLVVPSEIIDEVTGKVKEGVILASGRSRIWRLTKNALELLRATDLESKARVIVLAYLENTLMRKWIQQLAAYREVPLSKAMEELRQIVMLRLTDASDNEERKALMHLLSICNKDPEKVIEETLRPLEILTEGHLIRISKGMVRLSMLNEGTVQKRSLTCVLFMPIGAYAEKKFERTVLTSWSVEKLENELRFKLPDDIRDKLKSYKEFGIWGATENAFKSVLERIWNEFEGCTVVFCNRKSGRSKVIAWGEVVVKLHSHELAEKLWGHDEQGRTWEYVYFISNLIFVKDSRLGEQLWDKLTRALGYESFFPPGHFIPSEDRLRNLRAEIEKQGCHTVWEWLLKLADAERPVALRVKEEKRRLKLPSHVDEVFKLVQSWGWDIGNMYEAILLIYGKAIDELLRNMKRCTDLRKCLDKVEEQLLGRRIGLVDDFELLGIIARANDIESTKILRRIRACLRGLRDLGFSEREAYSIVGAIPFLLRILDDVKPSSEEEEPIRSIALKIFKTYLTEVLLCLGYGIDLGKLMKSLD